MRLVLPLLLFALLPASTLAVDLVNLDGTVVSIRRNLLYQDKKTGIVYAPSKKRYVFAREKESLKDNGEVVKIACAKSKLFADPSRPQSTEEATHGELPDEGCQLREVPPSFKVKGNTVIPMIPLRESSPAQ